MRLAVGMLEVRDVTLLLVQVSKKMGRGLLTVDTSN